MRQIEFDYSAVDESTAAFLHERARRIHAMVGSTVENLVEIGKHLRTAKVRLGHGNFLSWIDVEFGWSERQAQRLMAVSVRFESDKLSDLDIGISALYLIASVSMPESVRKEVIRRAENGERLTHSAVRAAVQEFKTKGNSGEAENRSDKASMRVERREGDQPVSSLCLASFDKTESSCDVHRVIEQQTDDQPEPVMSVDRSRAHQQESIADHDRVRPLVEFLISLHIAVDPSEFVGMLRARDLAGSFTKSDVRSAIAWLLRLEQML